MNELEYQKTNVGRKHGIGALILSICAFVMASALGKLAFLLAGSAVALSLLGLYKANQANGRKALLLASLFVAIFCELIISIFFTFLLPN